MSVVYMYLLLPQHPDTLLDVLGSLLLLSLIERDRRLMVATEIIWLLDAV